MWSYVNSEVDCSAVLVNNSPVGCIPEYNEMVNFLISPFYKIVFRRPVVIQVCWSEEGYYIAFVAEHPMWEGIGSSPQEAKEELTDYIYGAWLLANMSDEELTEGAKEEKKTVLNYIESAVER